MKRNLSALCAILLSVVIPLSAGAKAREIFDFNRGWKFSLQNEAKAETPAFDDSKWRMLNLPHDWSIEGEFSKKHPATPGGGALPGGTGWYRKTFTVPAADKDKNVYIDFDGVYCNSEVWINGKYLGKRPYGYISFRYDLTPYLKFGAEKNVIAVKADNSQQPNSRWYSGSGIYRHVWLVTTGKVAVGQWGTYITTPEVSSRAATVTIKTKLVNTSGKPQAVTLKTVFYDADGKEVAAKSTENILLKETGTEVTQDLSVAHPMLWFIENPYLYKAVSQVMTEGVVADEYTTPFGIRDFNFDRDKGFSLNGKPLKILGVCNHHDLGCLGSAVNTRALERQLEILKEMGCNGIRTSHNPPAPELLDLCDKMGFIVMDETFDMWKKGKNKFDYSVDWDKWHKKDMEDHILRDRNHPSVFVWSIGNEIPEQWDTTAGVTITKELAGIVKSLDMTRPITSACNEPKPYNNIIKSGALDLIGYNYHHDEFEKFKETFPGQKFIGTETVSALQTRGSYDNPSDSIRIWPEAWDKPFDKGNKDWSCSAYDNCRAPWGSTHEATWKVLKKQDYLSGMYIWTGFDYLGEPTPYSWPARSSYFGIVDLAGFPKDVYYMYQSEWTNKTVLHIYPHWNWKQGDKVDVWAYYNNADEVELFLDGKSLGVKKKQGDDLHVVWRVAYASGTLKAVSRKQGREVMIKEIKTAGKAAKIVLSADRSLIKADGKDLSFVTVKVVDADGNVVPYAENLVKFTVNGEGLVAGVDNGSPISHESFKANYRKAFNGLCLAVIQSKEKPGSITLMAISEGLQPATVVLESK